jgi:hypothetical protein
MSIDLSEGLGEDYSIINIFRLMPKTDEEIKLNYKKFNDIYDYFKLDQIGYYRTNIHSVNEVAHVLYLLAFEFFDPDKVKVVLERNTYGDTLLAHIPHVFSDDNNYSNHIFVRYKSRQDEKTTKMGIKVTQNKNLLVKDYQTNTKKGNVILHDQYTISQITTFTKQDTQNGNVTFKAESGSDDNIMSVITLSSVFNAITYKDSVDEFIQDLGDNISELIKTAMGKYKEESVDLNIFKNGYKQTYNKQPFSNAGYNKPILNKNSNKPPSFNEYNNPFKKKLV